jgi:hypothetical protein
MNYDFEDLSQKDAIIFSHLPDITQSVLLKGGRSPLVYFERTQSEGKFSLAKDENGKLRLQFHQVQNSPYNSFELSQQEQYKLLYGKEHCLSNGSGKDERLIFYDNETNEFIAINKNDIRPPDAINGTTLSESQKIDFREVRIVNIGNTGFRLDPSNEISISGPIDSLTFDNNSYVIERLAKKEYDRMEEIGIVYPISTNSNENGNNRSFLLGDEQLENMRQFKEQKDKDGLAAFLNDYNSGLTLIDIADSINRSGYLNTDKASSVITLLDDLNNKMEGVKFGIESDNFFTLSAAMDDREEDLRKNLLENNEAPKLKL